MTTKNEHPSGAVLDAMIPPPLLEKSLPILALISAIVGFFGVISLEPVAYYVTLFSPILYGLYLQLKRERRQRAQQGYRYDDRAWSIDLEALQRSQN